MALTNRLREMLAALEAEEAAKKSNGGNVNSFSNHGSGNQNYTGTKTNSGEYSGDGNSHHTLNNYGGRTIDNSGNFHGHGNGGFVDGNFDASTWNYNPKPFHPRNYYY